MLHSIYLTLSIQNWKKHWISIELTLFSLWPVKRSRTSSSMVSLSTLTPRQTASRRWRSSLVNCIPDKNVQHRDSMYVHAHIRTYMDLGSIPAGFSRCVIRMDWKRVRIDGKEYANTTYTSEFQPYIRKPRFRVSFFVCVRFSFFPYISNLKPWFSSSTWTMFSGSRLDRCGLKSACVRFECGTKLMTRKFKTMLNIF